MGMGLGTIQFQGPFFFAIYCQHIQQAASEKRHSLSLMPAEPKDALFLPD